MVEGIIEVAIVDMEVGVVTEADLVAKVEGAEAVEATEVNARAATPVLVVEVQEEVSAEADQDEDVPIEVDVATVATMVVNVVAEANVLNAEAHVVVEEVTIITTIITRNESMVTAVTFLLRRVRRHPQPRPIPHRHRQ